MIFSILYLNQTLYYILVVFPVVLDVQLHGLYIRYLCIHFKMINVSHSKCVTSVMKKRNYETSMNLSLNLIGTWAHKSFSIVNWCCGWKHVIELHVWLGTFSEVWLFINLSRTPRTSLLTQQDQPRPMFFWGYAIVLVVLVCRLFNILKEATNALLLMCNC